MKLWTQLPSPATGQSELQVGTARTVSLYQSYTSISNGSPSPHQHLWTLETKLAASEASIRHLANREVNHCLKTRRIRA